MPAALPCAQCDVPEVLCIALQAPPRTPCMTPESLLCCGGEGAEGWLGGREGAVLPAACTGSAAPVSACLNSTSSRRDLVLGVGSSVSLGFVMVSPELSKGSLDQASHRVGSTRPNIILLPGMLPLGQRAWMRLRRHRAGPPRPLTQCLTAGAWLPLHGRLEAGSSPPWRVRWRSLVKEHGCHRAMLGQRLLLCNGTNGSERAQPCPCLAPPGRC